MRLAFVGMDPDSPQNECPAVFVDPATGDFLFQGKTVTSPTLIAQISEHGVIAEDETIVWLPARMTDIIREALDAHDRDRHGPGQPTFEYLLANTRRSAVHLEMRDSYDETDPGFQDWQKTGSLDAYDWGTWPDDIASAVARGVKFRRARIVSEPISDYIRWEHALTETNVKAGEEVRWLSRQQAYDLMLPGADLWILDQRIIRYNFTNGDGTNPKVYKFTTDPRTVRDTVAAFEMVWERAIPHHEYEPN